jgi:superfamily II DNA or RNA helicase
MSDVIISKVNECDLYIDAEQCILYEISNEFSFEVDGKSFIPAVRKKYWDGVVRMMSLTTQRFPCGLIYRLCKFLDKHNYSWEFKDNKFYGVPYETDERVFYEGVELFCNKISNLSPRKYQVETIYQVLKEYRKTIVSPTGSGKSFIIYAISRYLKSIGSRTLIVVPTKSLVEQMYKDFKEYGWDVEENCHRIYQGHSLHSDKPVVISTYQSIYGLDKKWYRQYDGIIGDECHQFKSKVLQGIMKKCPDAKYRVGLTGTLDGKNVNQLILESHFGPVFKTTSSSDLMEKGFLAKLNVKIHIIKHTPQVFNTYNDEIEYLGQDYGRNKYICELAHALKGNVLVLFARVEKHGIPMSEMMRNLTIRPVHLIYGDTDVKEREQVRSLAEKNDDLIIFGSYGTMSTGVNIKNLHHVIFASPSKSRVRVLQSIGRGLRKANQKDRCMLYDVADDFRKNGGRSNFTLNHLAERIKYYTEEDFEFTIQEVSLNSIVQLT